MRVEKGRFNCTNNGALLSISPDGTVDVSHASSNAHRTGRWSLNGDQFSLQWDTPEFFNGKPTLTAKWTGSQFDAAQMVTSLSGTNVFSPKGTKTYSNAYLIQRLPQ
jgi:hypothetical protein